MTAPVSGYDHAVVNVGGGMDSAVQLYLALGFRLTARGHHSLGTMNHLIVLQAGYIELIGYGPGADLSRANPATRGPIGLGASALATPDAWAFHAWCQSRELPVEEPLTFTRPVSIGEGRREARFTVTRLDAATTPSTRMFVCQHHTPDLVWRPEWQVHPNGAVGVREVVHGVDSAGDVVDAYRTLFGDRVAVVDEKEVRIQLGSTTVRFISHGRLADLVHDDGHDGALVLAVADLDRTRAVLDSQGVPTLREDGHLVTAARSAVGHGLVFTPLS